MPPGVSSPLIHLARFSSAPLWVKAEHLLPSGSVFDRISDALVSSATGDQVTVIGEGSVCLSFAEACARRGLRMKAVTPPEILKEHRMLLHSFEHVTVVEAERADPGAEENVIFHPELVDPVAERFAETLGRELAEALPTLGASVDLLVIPAGTAGLAEGLRRALDDNGIEIVEVFADADGRIDGMASGGPSNQRVRENRIFETRAVLGEREGLLVGLSSAGCVAFAKERLDAGTSSACIALAADAGDRYFSRDEARRN